MAILPIYVAPHPVLKKTAEPVEAVDAELAKLMDDMLDTMYDAPGIGLAAPQVGVSKRILVMDVAGEGEPARPVRMANPEIVWESEDLANYQEGCLSFPEQFADVERPAQVRVRYIDQNNEPQEIEADGLLATCVQHEIDHLDGIVFVDYLSSVKRSMILRKLKKLQKQKAAAE